MDTSELIDTTGCQRRVGNLPWGNYCRENCITSDYTAVDFHSSNKDDVEMDGHEFVAYNRKLERILRVVIV